MGLVICTIVLYSWGRFRGCWVGFYSLTAAISCWGAPKAKGGEGRGGGRGGGKWEGQEAWGNKLGSVRGFVGCVRGEGSCAWHLSRFG